MKITLPTIVFIVVTLAVQLVGVRWTAAAAEQPNDPPRSLRVVVFGAHCDDPESGAGGLIALLSQAGHKVFAGYATCFRDDRKINGEPESLVRQRESTAACKLLGATPKFFPYAHEKLVADQETVKVVSRWLSEIKPDIVVTHWPLDLHPNHHVSSSLIWQCYQQRGGWNLYFFEVMTNYESIGFHPSLYLDIGPVLALKRQACSCFRSQHLETWWPIHEAMQRQRGKECGVRHAEAYLLVEAKPDCPLLPFLFKKHRDSPAISSP